MSATDRPVDSPPSPGGSSFFVLRWIRALYDWVLSFSDHPYGSWALFGVALAESSFFPIPPDLLLIPMCISRPRRALGFALICTLGSALGGALGYLLGFKFYDLLGRHIIEFYAVQARYAEVQHLYEEWNGIAVAVAGFTPIPYKVFTIAAGAFKINFATFMAASLLGRGGRFFILGGLILRFGARIQKFIDRYFNLLTVLVMVMLVGGFLLVKYVMK